MLPDTNLALAHTPPKPEHHLVLRWLCFLLVLALEIIVAWEAWRNERHNSAADSKSKPDHPDALRYGRILTAAVYVTVLDFCFAFLPSIEEHRNEHPGYLILFGLLTALPPAYFFFEAVYLHGQEFGKNENLKYSQDLASRIWAALTLLLGLYWFGIKG